MTVIRSRRRAFTITEMVAILILLGAFAIIGGRLVTTTFHLYANTAKAQNTTAGVETALAKMRDDVWSAKQLDVRDPHTAVLTMPDKSVITWTINGNDFQRTENGAGEHLRAPAGATFATDGIALTLKLENHADATGVDEIRMASEITLLAKLVP